MRMSYAAVLGRISGFRSRVSVPNFSIWLHWLLINSTFLHYSISGHLLQQLLEPSSQPHPSLGSWPVLARPGPLAINSPPNPCCPLPRSTTRPPAQWHRALTHLSFCIVHLCIFISYMRVWYDEHIESIRRP